MRWTEVLYKEYYRDGTYKASINLARAELERERERERETERETEREREV